MKKALDVLTPHPLNSKLYDTTDLESEQFQDLMKSLKENGLLSPIITTPTNVILSGHRRVEAAKALGWVEIECDLAPEGDERQLIVEYNRYRRKTISEVMREAELIEVVVKERAANNKALGQGYVLNEEDKINTRAVVSEAVGMKPRTYSKIKKIYDAAKENENAKEKLAKIDSGEISIDAAYRSLRTVIECEEAADTNGAAPDFIKYYNIWQFTENDPRFGIPHPGRIPGQIAGNVIYYYSEPGDLIVDPMAGGGSTIDAAKYLDREVIGLDVFPRRPDIREWNIERGFPDDCRDCQLIFMDPPYWNMIDEGYTDGSSSRKSLKDFRAWYHKLLFDSSRCVRLGGFVAVINMGQYFRLPDDFKDGYIDWPIETYNYMLSANLKPWARVAVPYPTTLHQAFDVEAAKKGRFFLPILGDIIIMRRMN